jgi:hypothetical protein
MVDKTHHPQSCKLGARFTPFLYDIELVRVRLQGNVTSKKVE